ncbi:MAG: AcrB/AcrD/AcrF family protein, partial [Amylibacter sp.]
PTVITLSFGLGFGMFLVLLIVPSLVIMQKDFGRLFTSLRRGILGGNVPKKSKILLGSSVVGSFVVLGLTLLPLALTQKISPLVSFVIGNNINALLGSSIIFIIGLFLVIVFTYLSSYLMRNKQF